MTNGEKFKTVEERGMAFNVYCHKRECFKCELNEVNKRPETNCAFQWLDLEYKEELKLCPFCGGEARIIDLEDPEYKYYQICCSKCMCKTESHLGMEETIAAWNMRVK
jgi:Lar family restriction alleviation protein